jgi:parallel beta-helix repeat protein
LTAVLLAATPLVAAEFHVSPAGKPSGDGTVRRPWDLASALAAPAAVHPGDVIWLHGGTYRGKYTSVLRGTAAAPVVLRAAPGERATIDGASGKMTTILYVGGAWTWYQGFEITDSDPLRESRETGSEPGDIRRSSCIGVMQQDGPHEGIKLINLVLHDGANGIGAFKDARNLEIYGNLVFNNGWDAPDRGHGHGIYAQNETGTTRIEDNLIFNQFSTGIHIYGSENAFLDNFEIVGNASFGNGAPSRHGFGRNLLLGGGRVARNARVESNVFYLAPSGGRETGGGVNLGYQAGLEGATVRDNFFANGDGGISLYLVRVKDLEMSRNRFVQPVSGFEEAAYPHNRFFGAKERPTGTFVAVRPNRYEKGRGHVVVLNWDRRPWVEADLSSVLTPGTAFEVRNAQDFLGAPVMTGVFSGAAVRLPMSGLPAAPPIGSRRAVPATSPEFAAFVVLPLPAPAIPSAVR